MPPREASGSFPDQYLMFDYDSVVAAAAQAAVVAQPQPQPMDHSPSAPAALVHHPQEQQQEDILQTNVQPTQVVPIIQPTIQEPVDPLSIDPTTSQVDPSVHEDEEEDLSVPHVPTVATSSPYSSDDELDDDGDGDVIMAQESQQDLSVSEQSSTFASSPQPPMPLPTEGSFVSPQRRIVSVQQPSPPPPTVASPASSTFATGDHDSSSSSNNNYVNSPNLVSDMETEVLLQGTLGLANSPSDDSQDSEYGMIYRNAAFDDEQHQQQQGDQQAPIALSFGPHTALDDLKYFAERGCIVALLQALNSPRLVTLGTRMLADYAKQAHRRVAVASNKRILQFLLQVLVDPPRPDMHATEYAVETIRSLTATEESDVHLMGQENLLVCLANTAVNSSEKARLHACIAIMNLSCGKANKTQIAKEPLVLQAMCRVMMTGTDEARLKATTCIKNLSNADANDSALLSTPGLVQALALTAARTCQGTGATVCTTNACLALMNLSIAKANKHRVFSTPSVMESLLAVLEWTAPSTTNSPHNKDARIKACSALSNLAIGYDNKIPMFHFPGFCSAILTVIQTDHGEARTKACSILWSFAAEIKNQIPVVQRGDILPVLVQVAQEDQTTEARFKCVAALTLLAESIENAVPLLEAGALEPLMDILHTAGADPTRWKGQTASWCVGFLMNMSQADAAVPALRQAGVVELLAPLLTLDHYQALKAAMAVTFCCRFDPSDKVYDLLRQTETVIPKIVNLLYNTLAGRGGNGYKYGVFTLRSSVGCIAALACGPCFIKERIATKPVLQALLTVLQDYAVHETAPAIVGGGRDDIESAILACKAIASLIEHLVSTCSLPFGSKMQRDMIAALDCYVSKVGQQNESSCRLASMTKQKISEAAARTANAAYQQQANMVQADDGIADYVAASLASNCCGFMADCGNDNLLSSFMPKESFLLQQPTPSSVRTFLLADSATGLRFVVPTDPSGGRAFNDDRCWCYRRGRFCDPGEEPDPKYVWTFELQQAYEAALLGENNAILESAAIMDQQQQQHAMHS